MTKSACEIIGNILQRMEEKNEQNFKINSKRGIKLHFKQNRFNKNGKYL